VRRHPNCVLCYQRGDGGGIVLIECLVVLRGQCANLLGYFWIDRILLLGKGWQGKADCQSCKSE
jgi:hypothetical protein